MVYISAINIAKPTVRTADTINSRIHGILFRFFSSMFSNASSSSSTCSNSSPSAALSSSSWQSYSRVIGLSAEVPEAADEAEEASLARLMLPSISLALNPQLHDCLCDLPWTLVEWLNNWCILYGVFLAFFGSGEDCTNSIIVDGHVMTESQENCPCTPGRLPRLGMETSNSQTDLLANIKSSTWLVQY